MLFEFKWVAYRTEDFIMLYGVYTWDGMQDTDTAAF